MKTLITALAGCMAIAFAATAAEEATKEAPKTDAMKMEMPAPPKAGAETKALKPIFYTASWTGKTMKDAMGPGSPEMTSKGKQTCKWVNNDLWVACDIEETMGTGKQAMTWKGHYLFGWDFNEKAYKSVGADSMGSTGTMTGKVEGMKLVMTGDKPEEMMGKTIHHRLTWDWSDGKNVKFMMEASMDGGTTWNKTSEATYKKGPGAGA